MKALGMNLRNKIIANNNTKQSIRLAKDKLVFKQLMLKNGITVPKTYFTIKSIDNIHDVSAFPDEFVIKPNKGYGGKGIIILRRKDNVFWTAAGQPLSFRKIKQHIEKIIDGQYSEYLDNDEAIVEERIYPSSFLELRAPVGLPDIRVLTVAFNPVMAMIRYPTFDSDGKANLSAGALGIGIEMQSGRLKYIYSKKKHRYFEGSYLGTGNKSIPKWSEILRISRYASMLSSLAFGGIDLVLDRNERVVVIEANAHPGLEIQNVNLKSLRHYINFK